MLHRSTDAGAAWEELDAPAYPPKPEGVVDRDPMRGTDRPQSLEMIWTLGQGADRRLWAGAIPGGLFASDDQGATWSLNRGLWDRPERRRWFGGGVDSPSPHSVVVHPERPDRVTVAVSCGGVLRTDDGGETWQTRAAGMVAPFMPPEHAADANIQDPHRVLQCLAAPDVLWCPHHSAAYRSTDAGRSWTSIQVPPSPFGFAVAAHPSDPDTAWFVPARGDERRVPVDGRVVVARPRDGGQSFEEPTRGLPQDHAYDLVYRHALDVDAAGDGLGFGSTTGNLWASDDGGDSLACLSHHLPPIDAVRSVG